MRGKIKTGWDRGGGGGAEQILEAEERREPSHGPFSQHPSCVNLRSQHLSRVCSLMQFTDKLS